MRKWLRALWALLTLTALALAGRGYVYCHMAERTAAACCCARAAAAAQALDAARPLEVTGAPCCERRASEPVVAASSILLEFGASTIALPPVWLVETSTVAPRRPPPPVARAVGLAPPRYPALARGSPPRRGKARARLGVSLC